MVIFGGVRVIVRFRVNYGQTRDFGRCRVGLVSHGSPKKIDRIGFYCCENNQHSTWPVILPCVCGGRADDLASFSLPICVFDEYVDYEP